MKIYRKYAKNEKMDKKQKRKTAFSPILRAFWQSMEQTVICRIDERGGGITINFDTGSSHILYNVYNPKTALHCAGGIVI